MANVLSVNTKKILHAIGALVDGAYLWAGADKGIQSEMQNKNNGAKIMYTISDFGDVTLTDLEGNTHDPYSGSVAQMSANDIKQRDVPVVIKDARIMLSVTAFEKMLTSVGEVEANLQIGQKIAKKAIKEILPTDIASINNIFVGEDYKPYQLAGAYLKSYTEGKLYGFMDWQAWGHLTAKGQQAVPCVLARPEFGKELVGKWSLIDELRVIPDIPTIELASIAGKVSAISAKTDATTTVSSVTVTLDSSATTAIGKTYVFSIPGVYNTDTNGTQAGLASFAYTATAAANTFTISLGAGIVVPTAVAANTAVKSAIESTAAGTYAGCIVRAEKAQCFGTAEKCACNSLKYSKETFEGLNIHCNEDSDVTKLIDYKRYDMVFASKLVEPRAAALIYIKIA